jgi:hypothetical protein
MFLDPTASHLIITTTLGENYYLHAQSRQPRALSRLKGVGIECIAWNPSLPTASTREILVGVADGNVYEVFIEPSTEFYRREEKYLKTLYKSADGAVTGLWLDSIPGKQELRRILVATQASLIHFIGHIGRHGHEGGGSIYSKIFESEQPTLHQVAKTSLSAPSMIAVSPDDPDLSSFDRNDVDRIFAWLTSQGIYYGKLATAPATPDLGDKMFAKCKTFSKTDLSSSGSGTSRRKSAPPANIASVALTQWHVVFLYESRIIAFNRLNAKVVFDQVILDSGQTALGLVADQKKNTFWLFTTGEIFEITITDEDRDVWRIMLNDEQFDAALQYAKTPNQKDAVATASGDHLISKKKYLEAASIYGKSSKPFETVALTFIDSGEQDALRKYLLTKLGTYQKSFAMQRVMIASWLVEVFMAKLNGLDDNITTKAELAEGTNPVESKEELERVKSEYHDFIIKYKSDLDRKTTYDVIGSHGREEELLEYATAINDSNYVLSYWVQRERWPEALAVLKRQTELSAFYKYSSVLILHAAQDLVDILTRQTQIDPTNLIPALLTYNKQVRVAPAQNQAIRYLLYCIHQVGSTAPAIHNTLLSLYASSPSPSEAPLLAYLTTSPSPPHYDTDFALRLFLTHKRIESAVHIYTNTSQYHAAVSLALENSNVELATQVASSIPSNPSLQKKLYLSIAKHLIASSPSLTSALPFLTTTPLLKIEDLLPLLPPFLTIDVLRPSICEALESYSSSIDALKAEMDESATTASNLASSLAKLDSRYVIVEPGEKCALCRLPLLSRQFWVFGCLHGFHADCLAKEISKAGAAAGKARGKRVRTLQREIAAGGSDRARLELESLVGRECVLCSESAVAKLDEPFVGEGEAEVKAGWEL